MSIIISNISKNYVGANRKVIEALKNVSIDVEEKSFVSLIGPSGCGKSTALHIAGGLLQTDEGEIYVQGLPPAKAQEKGEIGLIFQQPALLPWRTVKENITIAGEIKAIKRAKSKFLDPMKLIALMELDGFADHYPHELSGGMKQRVAIARSLYYEPSILLMDEPFGALDEITRHRMNIELLNIWEKTQKTVLFVTHNIEEAVFLSDRVIVMSPRPGRVVADIAIKLARPRSPEMKQTTLFLELQNSLRNALDSNVLGTATNGK